MVWTCHIWEEQKTYFEAAGATTAGFEAHNIAFEGAGARTKQLVLEGEDLLLQLYIMPDRSISSLFLNTKNSQFIMVMFLPAHYG